MLESLTLLSFGGFRGKRRQRRSRLNVSIASKLVVSVPRVHPPRRCWGHHRDGCWWCWLGRRVVVLDDRSCRFLLEIGVAACSHQITI